MRGKKSRGRGPPIRCSEVMSQNSPLPRIVPVDDPSLHFGLFGGIGNGSPPTELGSRFLLLAIIVNCWTVDVMTFATQMLIDSVVRPRAEV